jgi:hypothetical protein
MPIAIGTRKKVEKYYLWQSSVVSLAGKLPMKDTAEDCRSLFSSIFFIGKGFAMTSAYI